tara:strand:- start:384 stop:575 length:192 start_codon:yes stop_codon:yes gene_type:complete
MKTDQSVIRPESNYQEIDNEIKKDIYKYKFKTTKTPIKLKIVPTINRKSISTKRNYKQQKTLP